MSLIADPATWWLGHIGGALFKTQVADPVNALDARTAIGTWQTVTALAGFTGAPFQARLDGNGDVKLRGKVNKNTGTFTAGAWTNVGTLPAGYDPAIDFFDETLSANAEVRGGIRVDAGTLTVQVFAPTGSALTGFYVNGAEWSI